MELIASRGVRAVTLAAVAVAMRFAGRPEYANKTIVTLLADSGERYLSSALFR